MHATPATCQCSSYCYCYCRRQGAHPARSARRLARAYANRAAVVATLGVGGNPPAYILALAAKCGVQVRG